MPTPLSVSYTEVWDAMEEANLTYDLLHREYRGRDLFGGTAWGIVVDDLRDALIFASALGRPDVIRTARSENMGTGTIIYFPRVTLSHT